MSNSIPCLAFVDPIISPAYLVNALRQAFNQVILIAVYSLDLPESEKKIRFTPTLFDQVIYLDASNTESVNQALSQLEAYRVDYLFYGYESSVPLADQLANKLKLNHSNDNNTSALRSNKYAMLEAVRKAGLNSPHQMQVAHQPLSQAQLAELTHWQYPIFIKPVKGSASFGLKVCHSLDEINTFLTAPNFALLDVSLAEHHLIQEYLIGEEYYVDTVSWQGKHYLSGIYRYKKRVINNLPICLYAKAIDPASEEWQLCHDYIFGVLDAVGVENGFAHSELMLTQKGPCLIEVNSRIAGASGFTNKMAEKAFHTSQPLLLAQLITKGTAQQNIQLQQPTLLALLHNWQPRQIAALNTALLATLDSFVEALPLKVPGTKLGIPENLLDTVAFVLLSHPDEAILMRDYQQMLDWEAKQALF